MFMMVAHLLSTLTGQPYPEFVRERIFDPLGMEPDEATFSPSDAAKSGKLSSAWFAQDTKTLHEIPFWFNAKSAKLSEGAAGVITSVKGLVRRFPLNVIAHS